MPINHNFNNTVAPNVAIEEAGGVSSNIWNEDQHKIMDTLGNVYTVDELVAEHLGWFNVKQYGAKGDGTTDDTTAVNNTVTACAAAGGGTIYFPAGIYPCNGALQTSNGYNAVIPLPYVAPTFPLSTNPIKITFKGCNAPPKPYGYYVDFSNNPTTGVSIITSNTVGTGINPSLFGGPSNTNGTQMSVLFVSFEDLIIRQNQSNGLIGLQLGGITGVEVKRCNVDVVLPSNATAIPQPTNTHLIGIVLPQFNNSGLSLLEDCFIQGQYNAVWDNEMATLRRCILQNNYGGIVCFGGNHTRNYQHVIFLENKIPIYAAGDSNNGGKVFVTGDINIEDAMTGYWQVNTDHIYDPTNLLHGKMNIHRTISGSGSTTAALTLSGATNISPNIFIY